MPAIVGGAGLGLYNSTLSQLNGYGAGGQGRVGNGTDRLYINSTTGNLVIQGQDDYLTSLGLDVAAIRTYNSLGLMDDDNGDNWQLSGYQHLLNLPIGGATTPITRVNGDGHRAVFTHNGSYWIATDGEGAHDTLKLISGNWVYEEGSTGYKETYNAQGQLLNGKDADGNTVTYTYTGSLLTSVTDASEQITYLDYTGNNLTQIRVVSSGITSVRVRYGYDGSNRLTQVKVDLANPNDNVADAPADTYVTTYSYDGSSKRISRIQQSDGSDVSFQYVQVSGEYRISEVTTVVGGGQPSRVQSFSYDTTNRRTDVTDPSGGISSYYYDLQGRLIQVQGPTVDSLRSSTSYSYDAKDNITQVTTLTASGVSRSVFHAYDANGNLSETRDSLGNTVRRSYDASNLLLTETLFTVPDSDGAGPLQPSGAQVTRYVYDGERHLRFSISAEGRVTEHQYNAAGNRSATIRYSASTYSGSGQALADLTTWLTTADKTLGERIDYNYDWRGQLTRASHYAALTTAGAGASGAVRTHYVYNAAGQLLQTIAPLGVAPTTLGVPVTAGLAHVTTYTYDGLGRTLSVIDSGGRTTNTLYTSATNSVTVTSAHGLQTYSLYNKAGELISVQQTAANAADLGTTTYSYDSNGRLRMVRDPSGSFSHSLYDAQGRNVADIDANNNLTEYRYNAAGQLTQTLHYANLVTAALVSGTTPLAVTLSAIRPVLDTANDRSEYAVYDTAGRLSFIVADDKEGTTLKRNLIQITYDGAGRVIEQVQYAKRLASTVVLTDTTLRTYIGITANRDATNDRKTRSFYSADGLLQGSLNAQGYLSENSYDAAGRLISTVQYATPSANLTGTLAQARPASVATDARSYYAYDSHGWLIWSLVAEGSNDQVGYLTTYSYDLNGNRTLERRFNGKVAYDATATSSVMATAALAATPVGQGRELRRAWTYDSLNRVTQETQSALNATGSEVIVTRTGYAYDALSGFLISVTTAVENASESRITTNRYDDLGRLMQTMGGEGSAVLASSGTPEQVWLDYGYKHVYDLAGRKIKSFDPKGNASVYYYDKGGRLRYTVTTAEVAGAVLKGEVVETTYNAFGQVKDTIQYATRLNMGTVDGSGVKTVTLTGGVLAGALAGVTANATLDRKTAAEYTLRGQIGKVTDPLLFITNSVYNAFGDLVQQQTDVGSTPNASRRTDSWVYDRLGRRTTSTLDVGGLNLQELFSYDAFGRVLQKTDGRGELWKSEYDRLGRVVVTTDALNQSAVITYDAFDRVLTQTDRLGHTTTYQYTVATGRRTTTITTPEGVVTTRVRNRHGEEISVSLPNGAVTETTTYAYDRDGRLVSTTVNMGGSSSLNLVSKREYDKAGLLTATIDAKSIRTQYTYDPANRVLTRTLDPAGLAITTQYAYSAFGDVVRVTDAKQVVTETVFDRKGRATAVIVDTAGLKLATAYSYDAQGSRLTVREGITATGSSPSWNVGGAALKNTEYQYDKAGRRTREIVDPGTGKLNLTTVYEYDGNSNLISKTDPRNNVWRYEYDANNRQRFVLDPENGISETRYDDEGRVIATIRHAQSGSSSVGATLDLQDRVNSYVYDADGRLTYTIDGGHYSVVGGVPTLMSGAPGRISKTVYDAAGRVRQTIRYSTPLPSGTKLTTADLDVAAAVSGFTDSAYDQTTWSEYDLAGRLRSVRDAEGKTESYTYDKNGNRETLVNKLGYTWKYEYDNANRLIEERAPQESMYTITNPATALGTAANVWKTTVLGYDALGNLTSRKEGYKTSDNHSESSFTLARETRYLYDAAGRQVRTLYPEVGVYNAAADASATYTPGATQSYADRRESAQQIYNQTWHDGAGNAIVNFASSATASASATGAFTYKVYDAVDRLQYEIDGERYVTHYGYDANGNLVTTRRYAVAINQATTDAGGKSLSMYENEIRTLLNTTDVTATNATAQAKALAAQALVRQLATALSEVDSRSVTTTYDKLNRKTQVEQPIVNYFVAGSPDQQGTLAPTSQYVYNALGDLTTERVLRSASDWITTYYGYDLLGQQTHQVDAMGYYTRIEYDTLGRVERRHEYAQALSSVPTTLPNFATLAPPTALTPSAGGVAANDPKGYDRVSEFRYDRLDRLKEEKKIGVQYSRHDTSTNTVKWVVGDVIERTLRYNALGNVIAATDASGAITRTYYDKLGRVTASIDPVRQTLGTGGAMGIRTTTFSIANLYPLSDFDPYLNEWGFELNWSSLLPWSDGAVKVVVDWGRDGNDIETRILPAGAVQAIFSKNLFEAVNAGIQIFKEVFVGGVSQWAPVHTAEAYLFGPFTVDEARQHELLGADPDATAARLRYRPAGSTVSYSSLALTQHGASWQMELPPEPPEPQEGDMPAGNYEYEFLETVGGVESIVHSGTFAVARPSGEEPSIRGNNVEEVAPLTEFEYDVLGNAVAETRHAKGAANVTDDDYDVAEPSGAKQRSVTRYDRLGRVVASIDAANNAEYRSYDEGGNLRKIWQKQTDVFNVERWKTSVYQYDRAGRQTASLNIVRNPVTTGYVIDKTATASNAFGEQAGSGTARVAGVDTAVTLTDTAHYDANGRVWKMTVDGITRLYQYDLTGQLTAEAQIPVTTTINDASDIATAAGAIRTEYVRDKLGRITAKREPGFSIDTPTASDGDTAQLGAPTASFSGFTKTYIPSNPTASRYRYDLDVRWLSMAGYDLRPDIDAYLTVVVFYTKQGGGTGSYTYGPDLYSDEQTHTSASLAWFSSQADEIASITSVSVMMQGWATGGYAERRSNYSGTDVELVIPRRVGSSFDGVFKYRTAGSTGAYTNASLTSLASHAYKFSSAGIANGTYEYAFTVVQGNSANLLAAQDETYTGRFTVVAGKVTSVTPPAAASVLLQPVQQQTVDRWGNVLSSIDPRNAAWVTYYRYDDGNRLLQMQQPEVDTWSEQGVKSVDEPVTTYRYDVRGNLIATTNALDHTQRRYYDDAGYLIEERNATSGVTRHVYDGLGQEVSTMLSGRTVDRGYDSLGRVIWQQTQGYDTPRYDYFRYDQLGNLIQNTRGIGGDGNAAGTGTGGETLRYHYDTQGQLVETLLPLASSSSTALANKERSIYDARGRKVGTINGLNDTQTWTYDAMTGRLLSSVDLAGVTTTYTYDDYGRLQTQSNTQITQAMLYPHTSPNTRTTHGQNLTYSYYDNGLLKQVADGADNTLTTYEYDLAGNRTLERWQSIFGGTPYRDAHITYDALNRMQRASDVGDVVDYGYDLAGNRRWAAADYLTQLTAGSYNPFIMTVDSRAYWYKYDNDERMLLSQGVLSGGQIELSQGQGAQLGYDAHGNRAQTVQWEKEGSVWALVTRKHDYDPSDLIKDSYYEKAGTAQRLTTQRFYDTLDRITDYQDYGLTGASTKSRQQTYYDANGQVRNQTHYDWYNNNWRQSAYVLYYDTSTQARWYDDAGNLKQYQIKSVAGVGTQYTQTFQYGYIRSGGAYQEAQIYGTGQASQGGFLPGTTNQYFTANGFNNPKGRSRVDYLGQIVQKGGAGTYEPSATVQYYAYANGRSIGSYDSWHTVADFDYNYTPVSASYPPSNPGQYVVQYGDTLQKIAYSVFGDASLWYLIADTNGLSGSAALATGRMLDIPNVNSNVRNASDTFKPYNPAEIIGDTTPELRYVPPPPPKAACGGFLAIIVVIVVVVVAAITQQYYLATYGTTLTGVAAGTAGATYTAGSYAVAGAVGAAAGSIAGQAVSNAVGLQDGFSWSAVGKAALAGGLTAGLTNGIASATGIDQISGGIGGFSYAGMAQGALSSTIGQGVNVALGLQEKFSWAGVAAGALVGGYAKGATGNGPIDRPVQAGASNTGTFGQQFAGKLVTGLANRAITVALEGKGKIDFANIAADAFGNALGNSIVGAIQQADFNKRLGNLSGGARQAYDNVMERGYTPQQALEYAQGYQSIELPLGKPPYSDTPSITPLTADDFAPVDLSGMRDIGDFSINIEPETRTAMADAVGASNFSDTSAKLQSAQNRGDYAEIVRLLDEDARRSDPVGYALSHLVDPAPSTAARVFGGIQLTFGALEVGTGLALSGTGIGAAIGVPLTAYGADQYFAGSRSLVSGQGIESGLYRLAEYAGASPTAARAIEFGAGFVLSAGAGTLASTSRTLATEGSAARLSAADLKLSRTVEDHLDDLTKAGTPARPYGDSRLLMQEIMDAKLPIPDPGGVPGGLRWDVPGTMNGTQGAYQLVVDPKTGTVLHFVFTK